MKWFRTSGVGSLLLIVSLVTISTFANHEIIGTPPNFTSNGEPPATYVVDLQQGGNNLVLPCEVSGSSPITVSWFREGILIRESTVDEENNGTLSIRVTEAEANVAAPREGTNYHCEATNRIGLGNYNATLRSRNVSVNRYFFGGFRNTEVMDVSIETVVDGEVIMECDFNFSNPDPEVTWFANGTTMLDSSGGRQLLEDGRYLYIQQLSPPLREMRYHCEVRNPRYENGMAIRAPTTYTLNTNLPDNTFIEYKELGSRVGEVGQTVEFIYVAAARGADGNSILPLTLFCSSGANPLVDLVTNRPILTVTLTERARNMAAVTVSCTLSRGSVNRNVSSIITISGPASITTPARNDPSLSDRELSRGNGPVLYSCVVSGSPAPNITWYYNGKEVESGSNGVEVSADHTQLTVLVPQVSHSGIYQCFVENELGDDSRTWILEVIAPEIRPVVLSTHPEHEEISSGLLLEVRNDAASVVITAMVNSTIVPGVPTCPNMEWKLNGTKIDVDARLEYSANDTCDNASLPYTFNLTIDSRLTPATTGNYTVVFTLLNATRESQGVFITFTDMQSVTSSSETRVISDRGPIIGAVVGVVAAVTIGIAIAAAVICRIMKLISEGSVDESSSSSKCGVGSLPQDQREN